MKRNDNKSKKRSNDDIRQHYYFFKDVLREIKASKNESNEKLEAIMNDAYRYIKKISPSLYDGDRMIENYYDLYFSLIDCEDNLPKRFILDTKTSFDPKKIVKPELATSVEEYLLDYIVYKSRKRLFEVANVQSYTKPYTFDDLLLKNYCYISSKIVEDYCIKNEIPCKVVKIIPGYAEDMNLYGGSGFHYFTIAKLKGKEYLIDCTYKQFFLFEDNLLERVGVVNNTSYAPGAFMLKDEVSRNIAQTILKRGWIEMTDDILKRYLDGFTLSFRNGLGFEKNKGSLETKYSAEKYKIFLKGTDDMFNHECLSHIGQQEEPLKNDEFKLTFKK